MWLVPSLLEHPHAASSLTLQSPCHSITRMNMKVLYAGDAAALLKTFWQQAG